MNKAKIIVAVHTTLLKPLLRGIENYGDNLVIDEVSRQNLDYIQNNYVYIQGKQVFKFYRSVNILIANTLIYPTNTDKFTFAFELFDDIKRLEDLNNTQLTNILNNCNNDYDIAILLPNVLVNKITHHNRIYPIKQLSAIAHAFTIEQPQKLEKYSKLVNEILLMRQLLGNALSK